MTVATPTSQNAQTRHGSTLVLSALALFLLAARIPSYDEPLEWDMGMYSAIAGEMLHGERLYADAWDMKPPAIFATFAAAQLVVGEGFLSIYLLSICAAVVTMLGVYHAAGVAGQSAGLWAAAFWAAMAYDPWTGGDRPNTEVFINATVAWAFALWVRAEGGRSGWGRWVAIATLFAVGSMYKHVAVAPAICLAAIEVAVPPAGETRRRAMTRVALMAAVGLACWGALFGYFAATGRAWIFWQTALVNPRAYSGSILENIVASPSELRTMVTFLSFAASAAVLTVIAALMTARAAPRRAWQLFAGLLVGTYLAVAMPGAFLSHYFQLWLVPLSIGAGWGAAALPRVAGLRSPRLTTAATALALLTVLYPQLTFLPLDGRERGRRKYGDFLLYGHDAARDAGRMLLPDETLYTWSEETYVYHAAGKRPPAAGLWREHTVNGPLADWLTRRTLADLKRNPPELFLHWGSPPGPPGHPILEWSLEHYAPLPGAQGKHFPMSFYVRKGGALERRLLAPRTTSTATRSTNG